MDTSGKRSSPAEEEHRDKAPAENEMLKALNIVGLSWLTCPLQCYMEDGNSSSEDRGGGSHSQKGDQKVCSNYLGITLHGLSLFQCAGQEVGPREKIR